MHNSSRSDKNTAAKIYLVLWRKPWFRAGTAFLIYSVLSIAAYWPIYPGDPSRLPVCSNCLDPTLNLWFLRWTPFALAHGQNIFYTHWLNAPYGVNLAQNTLMPLLSLFVAPLTVLVSPIASLNFLFWLSFPISAIAMYYVSNRLTRSNLASFVAGLLYGFSPYMVGQGLAHPMLSFIPLPPLILLAAWNLLVSQKGRSTRTGLILAIEVIAQFFIEPEILAITAIMAAMAAVVFGIIHYHKVTRQRLAYAMNGLGVTIAVALIFLAYPIWFMLNGPNHFSGTNFPVNNYYRSDLIGLVAPTDNERIVPARLHYFASHTAGGDYEETGDYVGIVLLVVLLGGLIYFRRNWWVAGTFSLAFFSWVLSLGPHLIVDSHITSIKLPFDLLSRLPLFDDILPSRFSFAEWFFVAMTVALLISAWQKRRRTNKSSRGLNIWLVRLTEVVVVGLIVASLLPRWPYPSQPITGTEEFKNANHIIPAGTLLLSYPLADAASARPMLWQSANGMQFKLFGGYIQSRGSNGEESQVPPFVSPVSVEAWLVAQQSNDASAIAINQQNLEQNILTYLTTYKVGAVVVDLSTVNAPSVSSEFTTILGSPRRVDSMLLWNDVQHRLMYRH